MIQENNDYIQLYWEEIKSGRIKASRRVFKQYKKLVKEKNSKKSKWHFNLELANRPIIFIETFCRHSKGTFAGKLVKLELWQKAFISAAFGFVDENLKRRFQRVILYVARKNGKSTLAAAIFLYMLVADCEMGAEIYTVATKKDQAKIIFNEAVNMRRQSPELCQLINKRKTDLEFTATMSRMEPLCSDTDTLDGLNAHAVGIDELHAIKDRDLYDVMVQAMAAREQPLLLITTTAGTVRENIFDETYDEAVKIVDGLPGFEDERTLAVLYELDDRKEWTNPDMWIKANPGLGTIKKLEYIQNQVKGAQRNPKKVSGVLTKDFNIRETTSGSWLTFEQIENKKTFNIEDLRGCYAIGGVDLSSTTDLTCATLVIMQPEEKIKYVIQMYFVPGEKVEEKVNEDKVPYDIWIDNDLVRASEGNQVNFKDVTAWFLEMREQFEIIPLWIYYDRALAGYWVEDMEQNGFEMIKCAQGALTFSQPMKTLEADICAKDVNYNANPVLMWNLSNTSIKVDDNENIRPIKGRNRKMRIDGTVSLLNAYVGLQEKFNDYMAMV